MNYFNQYPPEKDVTSLSKFVNSGITTKNTQLPNDPIVLLFATGFGSMLLYMTCNLRFR